MKRFLSLLLCLSAFASFGQHTGATYTNSKGQVLSKPVAVNGPIPVDHKSRYYDESLFGYRPFLSRAEVLSYLGNQRYQGLKVWIDTVGTFNSSTGVISYGNPVEYVFGADLQLRPLTVATNIIGTIYKKTTFTSVTPDFTATGLTATISSGKINLSNTGDLSYNWFSTLENATIEVEFTVPNTQNVASFFGPEFLSANTKSNFLYSLRTQMDYSSGAGKGKIDIIAMTAGTSPGTVATSTALALAAGDVVSMKLVRDFNKFTLTASNLTQKTAPVIVSYSYSLPYNTYVFPNVFKPSVYSNGPGVQLSKFVYSSTNKKNAYVALVGDSKTSCNSTVKAERWASLLDQIYDVEVFAGPGNGYQDAINNLPEILLAAPENIILNIGRNDIGGSQSAILAGIDTFTARATRAGRNVYQLIGLWEPGADQTFLSTHATSTYPTKVIDAKLDNYTNNPAAVLISDNIHLNTFGNTLPANAVVESGYLTQRKATSPMIAVAASGGGSKAARTLPFYELANNTAGAGAFAQPFDTTKFAVFGSATSGFAISHVNGQFSMLSSVSPQSAHERLLYTGSSHQFQLPGESNDSALIINSSNVSTNLAVNIYGSSLKVTNTNPNATFLGLSNPSGSTSAYTQFYLSSSGVQNDGNDLSLTNYGPNFTNSGIIRPKSAMIYSGGNQDNGLALGTTSTVAPLYLFAGGLDPASVRMTFLTNGNSGIGTTTPAALLDVSGTTGGFLTPRMTTTQRDAIATPAEGLEIYNLTTHAKNYYNGTVWKEVATTP